jgi:hypothetical protein
MCVFVAVAVLVLVWYFFVVVSCLIMLRCNSKVQYPDQDHNQHPQIPGSAWWWWNIELHITQDLDFGSASELGFYVP